MSCLATSQLESKEQGEEWVNRDEKDTDPSLFLALVVFGRVYCHKQEVGRRGGGEVRMGGLVG